MSDKLPYISLPKRRHSIWGYHGVQDDSASIHLKTQNKQNNKKEQNKTNEKPLSHQRTKYKIPSARLFIVCASLKH